MYACIQETAGGFFEGVRALMDQARKSSDPPPPCHYLCVCLHSLRRVLTP